MTEMFRIARDIDRNDAGWGRFHWLSNPAATGASQITALDVTIEAGKGHAFHKHPKQEELICVLSGTLEQWVGEEKRILHAGDAVFIPAGVPHASFSAGTQDVRFIAIFGPSTGEAGFEMVELGDVEPWKSLRG
jgi:quercetin dioxygenase-like cupin family protein